MTWLVAGLGNPDEKYRSTRHNAGAMVVELLAERSGERFRKTRFVPAEVAEARIGGERVLLAKSHRFMNESGPSFASVAKKNSVPPEQLIAVHDEIDLPFGALRINILQSDVYTRRDNVATFPAFTSVGCRAKSGCERP